MMRKWIDISNVILLALLYLEGRQTRTSAFPVVGRRSIHTRIASIRLTSLPSTKKNEFTSEQEHIVNQAQTFDFMAEMFSNTNFLPPEIVAVYQDFSHRFLTQILSHNSDKSELQIIDVGCGAGVLFSFLLEAANQHGVTIHIDAVDLSKQMVHNCRQHAQSLLRDQVHQNHAIEVYADDAVRFMNQRPNAYNGVIANSCFANFWDQNSCIAAMTTALREGGVLCVAHPVGSRFVAGLHQDNPNVTPHLMPTRLKFLEMTNTAMQVLDFEESIEFDGHTVPMYYASALKT